MNGGWRLWSDKRKVITIILLLWALWTGHWFLSCCGSEGQLRDSCYSLSRLLYSQPRTSFWGFKRGFRFPHHTVGLMWLREGQTVEIEYRAEFSGTMYEAGFWFGPLEDWSYLRWSAKDFNYKEEHLEIRSGTGSLVRVAHKTGFHVLHYTDGFFFEGDFTVSWRAL